VRAANCSCIIASSIEELDHPSETYLLRGAFYNKSARLYELSGNFVRAAEITYEASKSLRTVAPNSSELAREYAQSLRLKH
jgi:hypothetical protein